MRVRTICGTGLFHRFMGKVQSQPQRAAIKLFFHVCITLSLRRFGGGLLMVRVGS